MGNKTLKKVILTTGGTGGHIFPALAVAEELRDRFPGIELMFLGGESGPEARLAKAAGLEFAALPVRGFFGRGLKAVSAGFRLLRGVSMARGIMVKFRPDLVIGFGGYAAAAGVFAAWSKGVPTMIHEQNSVPGIANRLLGRLVNKVCLSLPDAEVWFKHGKTVLTGNPVRAGIKKLYAAERLARPSGEGKRLLVLGGSQGAKALNSAILADLPMLLEAGMTVRIQAGAQDYQRVAEAVSAFPPDRVSVSAFIDDMDEAYAWADFAVCRAGATTVAELAVASLPAVFVPFPFATHNHQLHNAMQVQKVGAAQVIEQKDILPGMLGGMACAICREEGQLAGMAQAARLLANPEAAAKVVNEALKIVK